MPLAAGISPGMALELQLSDGRVNAVATDGPAEATAPKAAPVKAAPRPRKGKTDDGQGSLF